MNLRTTIFIAASFFIFCILPTTAFGANRYWVGSNGGNWNDTANWASANPASCTGGGASVPGSSDIAIFDADCDNNATIDMGITVAGININTGYAGSITPSVSSDFTIGASGFVQSAGTFTSTAGSMTISEALFTVSGGTFTHNSGTVVMSGTDGDLSVAFTASGVTFYNLTFTQAATTCNDSCGTIYQIVGSMTVANTLIFQNNSSADNLNIWGASAPTITVQGLLSIPSTAGSAALEIGSTSFGDRVLHFNVSGNATIADSSVTIHNNVTFNGTGNQTVSQSAGTSSGTWTVNRSSETAGTALKLGANFSARPFTVTAGTLSIEGYNLTSSASSIASGATFQLQGGETVTNAPTLSSGSTVKYNGTSTYTVKDWGYHHLAFDGSGGVFSLGAAESTAGNLTITNGTFALAGNNLTVTGTFSNAGTLRLQGGETTVSLTMDTDSGTVEYNGTSTYSSLKLGNTYNNLTFSGSGGSWAPNGAVTVNGALSISAGTYNASGQTTGITGLTTLSGGTYTAGSATQTLTGGLTVAGGTFTGSTGAVVIPGTLTVSSGVFTAPNASGSLTVTGNFAHSGGTFTHNSGTITLDGTDQTVSGSTTFNNFTKAVATARTLTFASSTTQTVLGTLTLTGQSGALLSLRSSNTGAVWSIDPQGTRTLSYIDVKDSTNANATAIDCSASNCTNSENNTNWTFTVSSSGDSAGYYNPQAVAISRSAMAKLIQSKASFNAFSKQLMISIKAKLSDFMWRGGVFRLQSSTDCTGAYANYDEPLFTNELGGINAEKEYVWQFSIDQSKLAAGTDTCFRIAKADGTPLDGYEMNASIAGPVVAGKEVQATATEPSTQAKTFLPEVASPTSSSAKNVATCIDLTKDLGYSQKGMKVSSIKELQRFLANEGFLKAKPTGLFITLTVRAVKEFQKDSGIKTTGVAGPATRKLIRQMTCL